MFQVFTQLMPDNTIYFEDFTIRANEVDASGKLTLPSICNFFQEVAGNNALQLNFDITDLRGQNLTWVLHRMDIKIDSYPDWRDKVTIKTWPASGDALRAYRNYQILDSKGFELGSCLSYWMMMNLDTRRPVRMTKEVLETRLADLENVLEVKTNRFKPFSTSEREKKITIRRADLDMNNHANNVRYIEWMLECLTYEETRHITNFDIIFMSEGLEGDIVTSSFNKESPQKLTFQLINHNGKTLALAEARLNG